MEIHRKTKKSFKNQMKPKWSPSEAQVKPKKPEWSVQIYRKAMKIQSKNEEIMEIPIEPKWSPSETQETQVKPKWTQQAQMKPKDLQETMKTH